MVRFRGRHSSRGFLLLDALAGLALMGGAVFLCLLFFRTEVGEGRARHERYAALLLAESEIERLCTAPYAGIPAGDNQALVLTLPSARQLKEGKALLSVKEIEPGIKQGTVTIQWLTREGHPQRMELTREFTAEGQPR